ncbi:MAG: putative toxin-antitoxin system toxin component, PIN family [Hydrogenophilales bacterium 28-61-23]|nr:MAG: putative toxin-antitoxin system toxin component, PIN family [Hydrogenophilales bacterium 28-61-23]
MLAVIDTNVLVSASINREGTFGQLVAKIRLLELTPVVCAAILDEYADVLRRPRFNFPQDWVDDLLTDMAALALHVRPANIATANLPDPSDAPFIATALAAGCPIVTGNARHFPAECGVEILSPAQCLARLIG